MRFLAVRTQLEAFRRSGASTGSAGNAKGRALRNPPFGPVAAQSRQARGRSSVAFRQALAPLALRAGSAPAGASPRSALGEVPCPGTFLQERMRIGWPMMVDDARASSKRFTPRTCRDKALAGGDRLAGGSRCQASRSHQGTGKTASKLLARPRKGASRKPSSSVHARLNWNSQLGLRYTTAG